MNDDHEHSFAERYSTGYAVASVQVDIIKVCSDVVFSHLNPDDLDLTTRAHLEHLRRTIDAAAARVAELDHDLLS